MISVIIPMYNNQNTIVRALESIRMQTAFDQILEIIVVNDGSKDDSLEVVTNYANGHQEMSIVIVNQSNGGASAARNAGMKIAKGEWIALLDADDEWLLDKIRLQSKILYDHPDIDFLGCNANDKELRILGRKINELYKANIKDLCLKCFPPTPAAIFRRQIVDDIGFFDETQKYGEDMNYFNKICLHYNYYHLNVQLVVLHRGESLASHKGLSSNLSGMHEGNVKNIKELWKEKHIGIGFYLFLSFFYQIKHFRRLLINKFTE